jgi:hypothetical protein
MLMFEKKSILKWLLGFNFILVIAYLISNHIFIIPSYTVRHWFDLDAEANIPTWFSSLQLFSLFVLSIIYSTQIKNKHLQNFYFLMGLIFLFFSADETSMIHEGITSIFNKLSIHSFFPDAHGMWVLIYPIAIIILTFITWKGLLAFWNEKKGKIIFFTGAFVFVTGGVGFEVFGYFIGAKSIVTIIEVTAEESFELLGQSLMIYALLSKLESQRTDTC